jgi:N-hydroxyarylamine O-acetyltransferase
MIDLDAYCRRIRYTGPLEPTLQALAAVCAAHTAAIPFENLDPLLGRAPLLAPTALQAKLVDQRRGGYCYEQNALLRLALLGFGLQVTSLAARVLWMAAPGAALRARSHMLLTVTLPNAPQDKHLVDVGFGGHLLGAPLRFQPGLVQRTPGGTERIVEDAGVYRLEAQLPAGWSPVYQFTLEPHLPVDYEPLNWYTGTHPGSIFCHNLRLERLTADCRAGLLNDKLTLRAPDGAVQTRRIDTADDLASVLDQVFDIALPVPADQLFARVPKGLDGAFMPG